MESFIHSEEIRKATLEALERRGVSLMAIADITLFLQAKYIPGLTIEACLKNVQHVLEKREVQNAILTGVALDMLAEQGQLPQPLQSIIEADESLYGVDEILALSILNIYGSIGYTNYGYIDKLKYGILETLNDKANGVHTFMDDLVGAVAAAAASRLAHHHRNELEQQLQGSLAAEQP